MAEDKRPQTVDQETTEVNLARRNAIKRIASTFASVATGAAVVGLATIAEAQHSYVPPYGSRYSSIASYYSHSYNSYVTYRDHYSSPSNYSSSSSRYSYYDGYSSSKPAPYSSARYSSMVVDPDPTVHKYASLKD